MAKQKNRDVEFSDLTISKDIVEGLHSAGYIEPSPIQMKVIPLGKFGLDIIAPCKAGEGKICAISTVALELVDRSKKLPQVLVVSINSKLTYETITRISKKLPISTLYLSSADSKESSQAHHILVGDSSNVREIIDKNQIDTSGIKLLVIDGSEETVNDFKWLCNKLQQKKQIMYFSPSISGSLYSEVAPLMKDPQFIVLSQPSLDGMRVYYSLIKDTTPAEISKVKSSLLSDILNNSVFLQSILFNNTVGLNKLLMQTLTTFRFDNQATTKLSITSPVITLSGTLRQEQKEAVSRAIHNVNHRIVVTNDNSARGVDFERINLIVNYDVPADAETFLFRNGRVGKYKSQEKGLIVILCTPEELPKVNAYAQKFQTTIEELPLPIPPHFYKEPLEPPALHDFSFTATGNSATATTNSNFANTATTKSSSTTTTTAVTTTTATTPVTTTTTTTTTSHVVHINPIAPKPFYNIHNPPTNNATSSGSASMSPASPTSNTSFRNFKPISFMDVDDDGDDHSDEEGSVSSKNASNPLFNGRNFIGKADSGVSISQDDLPAVKGLARKARGIFRLLETEQWTHPNPDNIMAKIDQWRKEVHSSFKQQDEQHKQQQPQQQQEQSQDKPPENASKSPEQNTDAPQLSSNNQTPTSPTSATTAPVPSTTPTTPSVPPTRPMIFHFSEAETDASNTNLSSSLRQERTNTSPLSTSLSSSSPSLPYMYASPLSSSSSPSLSVRTQYISLPRQSPSGKVTITKNSGPSDSDSQKTKTDEDSKPKAEGEEQQDMEIGNGSPVVQQRSTNESTTAEVPPSKRRKSEKMTAEPARVSPDELYDPHFDQQHYNTSL